MDLFDAATATEEQEREAILARAREERARREAAAVRSATHCQQSTCGAPIPPARQRALPGVQWCVECAARLERARDASTARPFAYRFG